MCRLHVVFYRRLNENKTHILSVIFQIIAFDELRTDFKNPIDQSNPTRAVRAVLLHFSQERSNPTHAHTEIPALQLQEKKACQWFTQRLRTNGQFQSTTTKKKVASTMNSAAGVHELLIIKQIFMKKVTVYCYLIPVIIRKTSSIFCKWLFCDFRFRGRPFRCYI